MEQRQNGILLSCKEKWFMKIAGEWMDLGNTILSGQTKTACSLSYADAGLIHMDECVNVGKT